MRTLRPAIALDPRHFGRGQTRLLEPVPERRWSLSDDVALFATTFAAGFLFVTVMIA